MKGKFAVAIVLAATFAAGAFAEDATATGSREEIAAQLAKVSKRLERFDKAKNRIFVEQHIVEVHRLRTEKEKLEAALKRLDRQAAQATLKKELPTLRSEVEKKWDADKVVDISAQAVTNGAVAALPVQVMAEEPVWAKGCGRGYSEDCVTAVLEGERPVFWIVRKDYDAEGRLIKVTPKRECALER